MDVLEAVRTRRSIGRLGGQVSDDTVRILVEAALWAPNHKRTKPWHFTLVRGGARGRLGDVCAAIAATSTTLAGAEREAFLAKEASKPLRAPAILIVSTRTVDDAVVATEDYAATAAAAQNILLAAHALGLGAIWRTGAMAYRPEVRAHLGLEPSDRIVACIYLGQPEMDPPPSLPRNVDEVLRFLT